MRSTQNDDDWTQWLRYGRHGESSVARDRARYYLAQIRNRVLENAMISHGDVVLDVGTGEGLIGLGALDRVGNSGGVVFSDTSSPVLRRCKQAIPIEASARYQLVVANAEDLAAIRDESVDVVTSRSVLIYIANRRRALASFNRVLRPGGRISLYEPIEKRMIDLDSESIFGFTIPDLAPIIEKIHAALGHGSQTLLDFDETTLLMAAESAGFTEIRVNLELSSSESSPFSDFSWADLMRIRPNPRSLTIGDAIRVSLTPKERVLLTDLLRPLVDSHQPRRHRTAAAYVAAVKR